MARGDQDVEDLLRRMGLDESAVGIYFDVATALELRDALAKGIEPYVLSRGQGLSHDEVLVAWHAGFHGNSLMSYAIAHTEGATHERIMEAGRRGIDVDRYSEAVMYGVVDADLYAAVDAGVDIFDYFDAHIAGAPHEDIMRARAAGLNLRAYAVGREGGDSHEAAVAYARTHADDW